MEEGAACPHNDGKNPCKGNLEMMDNFEFKEMAQSEYKKALEEWQKVIAQKKEENPPSEDDWECQKCGTMNKMDKKDLNSAICKKCKTKNEWVEYMIKLANDNETTK